MDRGARIYVAGHTGLVGSAILRALARLGYGNLLARTRSELDLTDRRGTEDFFRKERPEYVFLCAARVGGIRANSARPADFILQNIMIQANVIDLARIYGAKKLLFFGSSCIYPGSAPQPIREESLLTGPIEPTNEPFAVAKIAGIKMCQAYNAQYGTNFISVIPANVYGINDRLDGDGHVVASLIVKFHEAKAAGKTSVTVWGTGRPRREFLFADDLAEACVFLMERYDGSSPINVGTGSDISIAELAELVSRTVGFDGSIVYDDTRPDGNPQRLLDSSRINRLGWSPRVELESGLRSVYGWFRDGASGRGSRGRDGRAGV